ncbi:unnamed protein product [Urochloa humidicola]
MGAVESELARVREERRKMEEALEAGARLDVSAVTFDTDIYGGVGSDPNRFAGYDTSIPAAEEDAAEDEANPVPRRLPSYTGHAIAAAELPRAPDEDGPPKKS